jgi:hypothetical protein
MKQKLKFYELLKSNTWLSIELTFLKLYPEQEEHIEKYEVMYEALKFLQPIEMDVDITLYQYHDDNGQPSVVDVSGINLNPKPTDITIGLAIEFTSWDKWLGMGIAQLTLKEFSELEIICHCLNEMTYAGFDESEIQSEFTKLKSIVDDYKAMSLEEKEKNTISFEELKKRIN